MLEGIFAFLIMLAMLLSFDVGTEALAEAEARNAVGEPPAIIAQTATEDAAQAQFPAELPTTAGITIGTLNHYTMKYVRSEHDAELGAEAMVFGLTDAGKLEALLSYCRPIWTLPEETAALRATLSNPANDSARPLMNVREMLDELLLNAGGGPDYRYLSAGEVLAVADETIRTAQFLQLVQAVQPLAACERTDARSLMLAFTDEELAEMCADIREAAYGEWALRLEWLDAMEFVAFAPTEK